MPNILAKNISSDEASDAMAGDFSRPLGWEFSRRVDVRREYGDDVRGMVFGAMSWRYHGSFIEVEEWPAHRFRKEYPAREHKFCSYHGTVRAAVADYIASYRREEKLGDGTPCIRTLRLNIPNTEVTGRRPERSTDAN